MNDDFDELLYEDKVDLNTKEDIPDINKVTAQDMNNIKNCMMIYGTCTEEQLQEAINNSD